MELWERIARARKAAGLSQEELGVRLGVSRQAVSKWETGQTKPDLDTIISMCRELDLSADYLLLGAENGTAQSESKAAPDPYANRRYAIILTQLPSDKEGHIQSFLMERLECAPSTAKEMMQQVDSPLFRGLSETDAKSIGSALKAYGCPIKIIDDRFAGITFDIVTAPELDLLAPPPDPYERKEPMGCGMTVLAVAAGVILALFLLSIF